MGIFLRIFFFSLGQLFLAICCTWLHLASLGFTWLLAFGFGFTWLLAFLAFWLVDFWLHLALQHPKEISFWLCLFWLLVLGLFGFWLLAFSIRFTSHFAFGLLAFWLFAFGLCERNEDPTI